MLLALHTLVTARSTVREPDKLLPASKRKIQLPLPRCVLCNGWLCGCLSPQMTSALTSRRPACWYLSIQSIPSTGQVSKLLSTSICQAIRNSFFNTSTKQEIYPLTQNTFFPDWEILRVIIIVIRTALKLCSDPLVT